MTVRRITTSWGMGALLSALLCTPSVGVYAADKMFTVVTQESTAIEERLIFLPFIQYLASQLRSFGYVDGDAYVATDTGDAIQFFREKNAEIIIDSPTQALLIAKGTGATPILRRWKEHDDTYHTLFFVHKDSDIYSLEDLKGKVLAYRTLFTDSGYVIPHIELALAGFKQQEIRGSDANLSKESVHYVFSGDSETTITWVLYRKVDAGVLYDRYLAERFPHYERHFRVIYETPPVPRHIVSVRKDLDPALVAKIKSVLLTLHETPEGQRVLSKFQNTTKFDEIPPEQAAVLARYEPLVDLKE